MEEMKHTINIIMKAVIRIEGRLDEVNVRLDRLERDVAVIKKDVAVLKKDVTVLKKDVTVLKRDSAKLKEDSKQHAKDINSVIISIGDMGTFIDHTNNESKSNVSRKFKSHDRRISKLEHTMLLAG